MPYLGAPQVVYKVYVPFMVTIFKGDCLVLAEVCGLLSVIPGFQCRVALPSGLE